MVIRNINGLGPLVMPVMDLEIRNTLIMKFPKFSCPILKGQHIGLLEF